MIYGFADFFIDLFAYRRFVSSAKCSIWICITEFWRSLMKMMNNKGLNTDPFKTPWVTKHGSESKNLLIYIELSEIKVIETS